jgi:hypothetical protein
MKKIQYEKFKVRKYLAFPESLLWSVESIIYIIGGFYAGFMLRQTNNLIFLVLFVIILVIRFQWYRIEETTKKVKLI